MATEQGSDEVWIRVPAALLYHEEGRTYLSSGGRSMGPFHYPTDQRVHAQSCPVSRDPDAPCGCDAERRGVLIDVWTAGMSEAEAAGFLDPTTDERLYRVIKATSDAAENQARADLARERERAGLDAFVVEQMRDPTFAAAYLAVRDDARLRAEAADLRELFALQCTRMDEATARWRAEDPEARALMMPDLGALLTWLMAAADRGRAEVAVEEAG